MRLTIHASAQEWIVLERVGSGLILLGVAAFYLLAASLATGYFEQYPFRALCLFLLFVLPIWSGGIITEWAEARHKEEKRRLASST